MKIEQQIKREFPRGTIFHKTNEYGMWKIKRHFKYGFIEVVELLDRDGNPVNNMHYCRGYSEQRYITHIENIRRY